LVKIISPKHYLNLIIIAKFFFHCLMPGNKSVLTLRSNLETSTLRKKIHDFAEVSKNLARFKNNFIRLSK